MFRPSTQVYLSSVGRGLLVVPAVCLVVLVVLAFLGPRWLTLGVVPAFVLIVVGAALAYSRWAFVRVDPDVVHSVGFLGRRRRIARSRIASVLLIGQENVPPYVVGSLYLRDAQGRQLLRLTTGFWIAETLHALAVATGAPLEVVAMIDKADLVQRHPGLLPLWRRTQLVLAFTAFLVVGAALLLLGLLLSALER